MCSRACCKYGCGIWAVLLAIFLSPLLSNTPKIVKIDDVREWGLKGPYLSTLSDNMKGVYFLDGNQVPWTATGKCSKEDAKNNTLCRNGWKRSQLMIFDTSYMHYDRANGIMTQHAPALGASEHKVHKGGLTFGYLMLLLRQKYVFNKRDPEFADRSAELFEGSMKLFFGPLSMGGITQYFAGVDYRVTAEDVGDGSTLHRYTWIGGDWPGAGWPYNKPGKKSEQFHDYKYTMRRLLDAKGNVDRAVLADIKKVFGENLVFLGA